MDRCLPTYMNLNKDRRKEEASIPGIAANLIPFSNAGAIIPFPQQLRMLLSSMKIDHKIVAS